MRPHLASRNTEKYSPYFGKYMASKSPLLQRKRKENILRRQVAIFVIASGVKSKFRMPVENLSWKIKTIYFCVVDTDVYLLFGRIMVRYIATIPKKDSLNVLELPHLVSTSTPLTRRYSTLLRLQIGVSPCLKSFLNLQEYPKCQYQFSFRTLFEVFEINARQAWVFMFV